MTDRFDDVGECVAAVLHQIGPRVVLALPLGIGKPNHVANEFVRRAVADPTLDLTIVTALSLQLPTPASDLERRLVQPIVARIFGAYPELDYVRLAQTGQLPTNIQVIEFFVEPGKWLNVASSQRDYLAANYTHVARELAARGVNVIAQLVARREVDGVEQLSLGSNPDVTLDLLPHVHAMRAAGRAVQVVGVVHAEMPFMLGHAVVPQQVFDLLLDHRDNDFPLFAPPNPQLSRVDHAIGVHASSLVRDGGTLQIGIGELGDALCYSLLLRQQNNAAYRAALRHLGTERAADLIDTIGGRDSFQHGLFGSTEMFVDQMLDLLEASILQRRVYDWLPLQLAVGSTRTTRVDATLIDALLQAGLTPQLCAADFERLQHFGIVHPDVQFDRGNLRRDQTAWRPADLSQPACREYLISHCLGDELHNGTLLHAGFLLGPRAFYAALRELPESQRALIDMRSVGYINQLYGDDYLLRVAQRTDARHINTTMMVTLQGAAISDSLDDGRVVSGVGGQYNFVAMAHALPGAHSILCVRATRTKNGVTRSNIVSNYGTDTIPRHLRDVVITEYGIASLRGRTDGECAAALISIADSRFQSELIDQAKRSGKLRPDFELPEDRRNNSPASLQRAFQLHRAAGQFDPYPFGTELTAEEMRLGDALRWLALHMVTTTGKAKLLRGALLQRRDSAYNPHLARLLLESPRSLRERLYAKLVAFALTATERQDS